jgi:hypothetical protein
MKYATRGHDAMQGNIESPELAIARRCMIAAMPQ